MSYHPRPLGFVLILTGVLLGGVTLVGATLWAPDSESATRTPTLSAVGSVAATSSYPLRLRIPKLRIDASVQKVGINAKGNMGVPSNFTGVAWYKPGAVPGELGSAVIDGHVDNGLALAGVFKHLNDVAVGDDVYVKTVGNKELHFKVVEIENYPYGSVPTDMIFNRADVPRLNLITCDGSWVAGQKTYDHRFVVYSTLVS